MGRRNSFAERYFAFGRGLSLWGQGCVLCTAAQRTWYDGKWNTAAVCHGGVAGVTLCCPGGEWACRRQAAELSANPASRRVKVCDWRMGEPRRSGWGRAQRFPHQKGAVLEAGGFGQESGRESLHYFWKASWLAEAGVRPLHRCPMGEVWQEMGYGSSVSCRRSRSDTLLSGRRVGQESPPWEMGRGDAPKGQGVGMVHKENITW